MQTQAHETVWAQAVQPLYLLGNKEPTREHAHMNTPTAGKASLGHPGQATARSHVLEGSACGIHFDI